MPAEEAPSSSHASLESSKAVEHGGEMEALPALGDKIQAVLNARRAFIPAHAPHTQTADEPARRKHRPSLTSVAEISEVQDAEAGRNSPSRVSAATAETSSDTKIKMVRTSETHDVQLEVVGFAVAHEVEAGADVVEGPIWRCRAGEASVEDEREVTVEGLSTTGTWKWRDAVRGCLHLTSWVDAVRPGGEGGTEPAATRTPCFPTGTEIDVVHEENVHWRISGFVKKLERYSFQAYP